MDQGHVTAEMVEDPATDSFKRRLIETLDIIEIMMIEPFAYGPDCVLQGREIGDPARPRVRIAAEEYDDFEGVAVQPCVAMIGVDIRR